MLALASCHLCEMRSSNVDDKITANILCAKHCSKRFMSINSFGTPNKPVR